MIFKFQANKSFETILPEGDISKSSKILLMASIKDSLGAIKNITKEINVIKYNKTEKTYQE